MPTKINSKRTTKKVDINKPTISKKNKKQLEKSLKNLSLKHIAIAVILLIFGFAIGAGAYFGVCRNDCFELIGESDLTLSIGDSYVDEGVKIIEFGKDVKSNVYIETNLQQNNNEFYTLNAGTFYIKYYTSSLKFGKIFKISKVRLITFIEESESGE